MIPSPQTKGFAPQFLPTTAWPHRPAHAGERIQRSLLIKVGLVAAAPLALLALGLPYQAGKGFWGLFCCVLAWQVMQGRRDELLALALALGPMVNLLRAFATYNVVVVLYAGLLGFYLLRDGRLLSWLARWYPMVIALLICISGYWLASLYNTHEYAVNLRLFELGFSVAAVLLLARQRVYLGAMLLGLILTSLGVALAMLPHYFRAAGGARLGLVVIGDYVLGNPVQLGVPLALGFLALAIDRGSWLCLRHGAFWRPALLAPVVVLLAFTTSRAAWGMAALGIVLSLLFGQRQRFQMLLIMGIGAIGLCLLLRSSLSHSFSQGVDRTFSSDGSLAHRTSGRSDQWRVSWFAFTRTPQALVFGYGPGSGSSVYSTYAPQVEGVVYGVVERIALHSLFMQIMVEGGAMGLLVLVGLLSWVLWRAWIFLRHERLVFPLVCVMSYIFVVITVSGNDTISGSMLAIGMLRSKHPAASGVPRLTGARNTLSKDQP